MQIKSYYVGLVKQSKKGLRLSGSTLPVYMIVNKESYDRVEEGKTYIFKYIRSIKSSAKNTIYIVDPLFEVTTSRYMAKRLVTDSISILETLRIMFALSEGKIKLTNAKFPVNLKNRVSDFIKKNHNSRTAFEKFIEELKKECDFNLNQLLECNMNFEAFNKLILLTCNPRSTDGLDYYILSNNGVNQSILNKDSILTVIFSNGEIKNITAKYLASRTKRILCKNAKLYFLKSGQVKIIFFKD